MNDQYKISISDARWIAYDIPGNIGWITWLVCVFRGLRKKRDAHTLLSALPGVLMLIGVLKRLKEYQDELAVQRGQSAVSQEAPELQERRKG